MGLMHVSIRIRPWSPYLWLQTVTAFGKIAVSKPEQWLDLKGGWSNTWRSLISLATKDYPYEGHVIRHGVMSVFGADNFPISEDQEQVDYKFLWPLVTNLFFFELHSIQKREGLAYDCEGTIRFQPSHHSLFLQVATLYGKSASLCVQGKTLRYCLRCSPGSGRSCHSLIRRRVDSSDNLVSQLGSLFDIVKLLLSRIGLSS